MSIYEKMIKKSQCTEFDKLTVGFFENLCTWLREELNFDSHFRNPECTMIQYDQTSQFHMSMRLQLRQNNPTGELDFTETELKRIRGAVQHYFEILGIDGDVMIAYDYVNVKLYIAALVDGRKYIDLSEKLAQAKLEGSKIVDHRFRGCTQRFRT